MASAVVNGSAELIPATVPESAAAGTNFTVVAPNGQKILVTVPQGVLPGQTILVRPPPVVVTAKAENPASENSVKRMSSLSSCPASDGTGLDTDATFEDTILGTREQVLAALDIQTAWRDRCERRVWLRKFAVSTIQDAWRIKLERKRNLERRRREASDAIVKKATQNVRNLFSVRFAVHRAFGESRIRLSLLEEAEQRRTDQIAQAEAAKAAEAEAARKRKELERVALEKAEEALAAARTAVGHFHADERPKLIGLQECPIAAARRAAFIEAAYQEHEREVAETIFSATRALASTASTYVEGTAKCATGIATLTAASAAATTARQISIQDEIDRISKELKHTQAVLARLQPGLDNSRLEVRAVGQAVAALTERGESSAQCFARPRRVGADLTEVHAALCEALPVLVQRLQGCHSQLHTARVACGLQIEMARVQAACLNHCHQELASFRNETYEVRAFLRNRQRHGHAKRAEFEAWWREHGAELNLFANGNRALIQQEKAGHMLGSGFKSANRLSTIVQQLLFTRSRKIRNLTGEPELPPGFRRCGPNGMFTYVGDAT